MRATPALDRAVRLTSQGPGSAALEARMRGLLGMTGIRTPDPGAVAQSDPARGSGRASGGTESGPSLADRIGAEGCRATDCPVLALAALPRHRALAAAGVRLRVTGKVGLSSPVPLGFAPRSGGGAPVVLSGDPAGLHRLPALRSVYRTQSWLDLPDLARLHSWQLAAVSARLQRMQAALPADGSLVLTAPFAALDAARAQADRAPRGLLIAGGGALAALAGFLVLSG